MKLLLDLRPLRSSRAFRRLWFAQMVSFVGSEVSLVAIAYQVYALTGSTVDVGLVSLAQFVPLLTLTIVGGAFADTFDRRRLMLLQQSGMIVGSSIAVANAFLAHPRVWPLFVSVVVTFCAYSFGVSAQNALLPRIVADDEIVAANNLNGLIGNLGAVAGPALAGGLIATTGVGVAYVVDTVTFFATLLAVALLPSFARGADDERPSVRSIVDGFRFVRRQPVIFGFMLVDTNAMFFGMPTALFPAIATHRFHHPSYVGYLFSAMSAGALVGSAFGGWTSHVRRQGVVVIAAAAAWGLAVMAFAFATQFWLALLVLAIGGGADLISAVLRSTMLIRLTPDSLLGRLFGIEFAQVTSAPALGNLKMGALASLTSIRFSLASGGVAVVAGCAVLALACPALVRYDAHQRA
ncbi:MAG TPA: MFS transporter [Gaiellaceae bacterium]|nr:MFS transporter [Gaiellaceae bacterium]